MFSGLQSSDDFKAFESHQITLVDLPLETQAARPLLLGILGGGLKVCFRD